MASTGGISSIDNLIGGNVLSRSTANKLGQVHDLIVDVAGGGLLGLSVQTTDEGLRLVERGEIYSFGPDAVMIKADESAVAVEDSPLKASPLAKHNLTGVNVVTEGGRLLGQIVNVYIHLAETPLFIYEVRSSILDKLLGHSLYFPASLGIALSEDLTRLVVAEEAGEKGNNSLDALASRLFGPPKEEEPIVVVRSRGY